MMEDPLTRDERIRLEALAQAGVTEHSSWVRRLGVAKKFEDYIRGRVVDMPTDPS